MKIKALLGCLMAFSTIHVHAQFGYYESAFGLNDDNLKASLHAIISNHSEFSYTASSTDVWDILKVTDRDTANPDNVILIYSGRSVNAAQEYNSAAGWSREHVWAKSRGDFGTSPGPGTDVHHLRPCDVSVNSTRNNRNFDNCVTCQDVVDNGYNTGSKRDASLWTFEPPSEVKGDVARMIMYMAIRYEGGAGEPDLELTSNLLDKSSKQPLQANLATLLEWNRLDSVSDWERHRNDVIFSQFQGNRNPFIDHPELAEHLWGDRTGMIWYPDFPASIPNIKEQRILIYPNPVNEQLIIQGSYVNMELINLQGNVIQLYGTAISHVYSVSQLPKGTYILRFTLANGTVSFKKFIKV